MSTLPAGGCEGVMRIWSARFSRRAVAASDCPGGTEEGRDRALLAQGGDAHGFERRFAVGGGNGGGEFGTKGRNLVVEGRHQKSFFGEAMGRNRKASRHPGFGRRKA